ncbi:hypothetical protein CDL15_Pgr027907 [Punica granatum]|uniref:Uncharacterized protein n=1 Tax=Punica granatum TaxID=22663 RepID=A0A218XK18_PUNGR|nr:hypothetical protein CDL15_Pgr027907 [Punica granatum]
MEESSLSPECPVCLQVYDGSDTVPRVLPCGHSACQSCLGQLPERFPQTIRCPACTQLVKFPSSRGPSSLPKNIDLLRLCGDPSGRGNGDGDEKLLNSENDRPHQQFFLPDSWSNEFYTKWRELILPQDAISVQEGGNIGSIDPASLTTRHCFRDSRGVSLFPLFPMSGVSDPAFRFSYLFRVMNSLSRMGDDVMNELTMILGVGSRQCKVSGTYGFWGHVEEGICYLVCERHRGQFSEIFSDYPNGFIGRDDGNGRISDRLSSFAMIGLEICEAVMSSHEKEFILGCLGLLCVNIDNFGHISIDLTEVLVMARQVRATVAEFLSGRKTIGSGDFAAMFFNLLQSGVYVSPDVLLALLKKKQVTTEDSLGIIDSASYGSDVWAVGCMLIKLLVGKEFTVESWRLGGEEDMDFSVIYEKWLGDVSSLLETKLFDEYQTLCQMLLGCLNLDRRCRPVLADVWKSVRELLTKHWFDNLKRVEVTDEKSFMYCLILGKLCQMSDEVKETSTENDLHEINAGLENHNGKEDPEKDLGESLSQENVKCKELRSHLDCVTGLAVGGDLLFSSSFDKTLQLWSLQDFSHVHTFRGHEHKIMAVVYVDDEQPLCVTADGGGGIFVWDIGSFPLGNEPLKKCMEGHKSVVSSLVVSQGALYSGSWDGMIRLWCLSDHSPLTVLGEEIPGKIWKNEMLMKSVQSHRGAIFSVSLDGKWLFTGGWDKTVSIQELSDEERCCIDLRSVGSISCGSVITALLSSQGKLFVASADRTVKCIVSIAMDDVAVARRSRGVRGANCMKLVHADACKV